MSTFNPDILKRWDLIAMCISMAVIFTLEMFGVFGKHCVTITAIVRLLPKWLLAMVWGWLGWHFIFGK